jgi:hypothetical protein
MNTAIDSSALAGNERFYRGMAIAMAVVIVAGFSLNLAMGRSTFYSPPLVHAHAIIFMGWMVLYVAQNVFVATNQLTLHRRLGWIAASWMVPMMVLGFGVVIAIVRRGTVPFFFQPVQFLVFDPISLLTFAGLTSWAIVLRRQTDWHRRLHLCATSILLGPGFGRLLPMPLLAPWAWETVFAVCLLFPLIGVVADLKRSGKIHPAWRSGIFVMLASFVLTEAITYSPVGQALYRVVTTDSPGASVAPLAFAPPPVNGQVTGR